MAEKDVKVLITGDATGLFSALGSASQATKGMAKEMETAIMGVKNLFLGFTAALGGWEFLKGTVNETKNWTVEAQKLARVLGITTEQASALNLAIGDIYGTQEEYLGAVGKLTKTLNTNEEAFTKLGVATRDQNGRLRDTPSIMAEVNQALMGMKQGTDRNIASAQIYGKSWMEVQRYLKLTPEVMAEAEAKARRLNLIVGQDSVTAVEAYRASMNELEDTVKALKIGIGQELLPLFSSFNNTLADDGPVAVQALGYAMKYLSSWCQIVAAGFRMVVETVLTAADVAGQTLSTLGGAASLAASGFYAAAGVVVVNGLGKIKSDVKNGVKLINEEYENLKQGLYLTWSPTNKTMGPNKPTAAADGAATPKGKEEPDKEFERLKAKLAAEKDAYEQRASEEGTYLLYTKEMEDAFWKKALASEALYGNSLEKARQAQFAAAHEARKKQHAADEALGEANLARQLADTKSGLDLELFYLEDMHKNARISDEEALAWKMDIEIRRNEAERTFIQDRINDKTTEVAAAAKLQQQLEALDAAHTKTMEGFRTQQDALSLQKDGWAGLSEGIRESLKKGENWFDAFKTAAVSMWNGVENAFANGIQGILSGQMSLSQGLKSIWQGIVSTIIGAISKLIAQYVVLQIADMVLTKGQVAASGAKTAAYMTEGAAGAWAAYGWMPYVGAALAQAQITAMGISVAAAGLLGAASAVNPFGGQSIGGVPGAAEGAWFGRPTLAVIGEGDRPELVVPDTSFKDFARNLTSNILAQERQSQGYLQMASAYAGAGVGMIQINTGPILGESAESGRIIGDWVHRALQNRDRRNA